MANRLATVLRPENSNVTEPDPDSTLPDDLRFDIQLGSQVEGAVSRGVSESLKATAAAAVEESDRTGNAMQGSEKPIDLPRVDSTQETTDGALEPPAPQPHERPLAIRTTPSRENVVPRTADDSIINSPTLRKHAIPVEEGTANTLPAVQPASPVREASATSSTAQSLPSFRQLTGQLSQLTELAEAATQQDSRLPGPTHHHTPSFSSTTSQSPIIPLFATFSGSTQASPTAHNPINEGHRYTSPPQYPTAAYYHNRRSSSVLTEAPPSFPPSVPSLPSQSSGESYATSSTNPDGYSTTHTTPIDGSVPLDSLPRPLLPPLSGITGVAISGFQCDYPGCTAMPFQTQYLLSSHRNVHSQNRPHYCPVKDCPRSEGGKGFKRKNEMIRHGLVHNSPGYVCPFCPDREHRYPRPDNLQRHVRVHHVDRDRDDPALREVLAQRQEGAAGKQRRRRTQQQPQQPYHQPYQPPPPPPPPPQNNHAS